MRWRKIEVSEEEDISKGIVSLTQMAKKTVIIPEQAATMSHHQ
jgi:hypothetical protein